MGRVHARYYSVVRAKILLAMAATWFIWGSTYLFTAIAVRDLPPFLLSGLRNVTAGMLLYAVMRARGTPRPSRRQWLDAIIVGTCLLAFGNGAVTWAAQREPSGVIALIISLVPLWLLVIDWLVLKRLRPSAYEVGGILVGLVGVALLALPQGGGGSVSVLGLAVLVFSGLAWASGSLYSRGLPPPKDPLVVSGMEMLMGGVVMLGLSAASGEWASVHTTDFTPRALLALGYLVLFGSALTFSAYKWLLKNVRPVTAGTYAFVNPVVAMLLGWLFAGEVVTGRLVFAMALIVGAVAMITVRPYLMRR